MTNDKNELKGQKKLDKAKKYVKDNWKPIAIGAGTTAVTIGVIIVAKRVIFPNQTAMMIKKLVIKDSVLIFSTYARKQGPPSYVIEHVRTGEKFVSQADCARAMGISKDLLSRHLNGMRDHVNGEVYRRLAMAVPNTG